MAVGINQLSPGVGVTETDMTTSLPAIGTSGGGFAGNFMWGPVDERTTLSDKTDLENIFGKPTDDNFVDWFSAHNFLAYTTALDVVRVIDNSARNASDAVPLVVKSAAHFREVSTVSNPGAAILAKYPGSIGNSLEVQMADASSFAGWAYADAFDTAPGTSSSASDVGASNDEIHVVVIDKLGQFSGVVGSVLERFPYLSKASDGKDSNGGPAYYVDVLNNMSAYVWVLDVATNATKSQVGASGAGKGGGSIGAVTVTAGGKNYVQGAPVTITGGSGNGFSGTINVRNGVVASVGVATGGKGYTSATVSAVGTGVGFQATATIAGGVITAITVLNGGQGYGAGTSLVVTGDGSGATLTPTINNGVIASVNVINPGLGYSTPVVSFTGGSGATGTATAGPALDTVDWGTKLVVAGVPSNYAGTSASVVYTLASGQDSVAITSAELAGGYDQFANADTSDVSLVFMGSGGGEAHNLLTSQHVIDNIAEVRKDCLVFVSPNLSDVQGKNESQATQAVRAFRHRLGRSSSYAVMDSGWKIQYDVYNNKYRTVPLNADIAGLCALVDTTNDPWWSPGGYNRGRVKNVVSLLFSPSKTSRDNLYKDGVNPVTTFSTDGTILMGDKTLQGKQSAFSYIGIRRLFIALRKQISSAAKYTLFDFNTVFTRSGFVNMVEPRLRDIQGRQGMDSFYLQCDEKNNTDAVIQAGEFRASVFIKPMYSIQWVSLNFVAVRREVSFDEVVAQS